MSIKTTARTVFSDIGFDDVQAKSLERKADLMMQIDEFIRRNHLTQAKAGDILGISQPRVSDLINGRLSLFSLDELVRMCDGIGSSVVFVIEHDKPQEKAALLRIVKKQPRLAPAPRVTSNSTARRLGGGARRIASASGSFSRGDLVRSKKSRS